MEHTAKITSKGQITIPADVRRKLGVRPGDRLRSIDRKSGIQIVRKPPITDVFEKYRGTIDFGIKGGRAGIIKYIRDMRDGTW